MGHLNDFLKSGLCEGGFLQPGEVGWGGGYLTQPWNNTRFLLIGPRIDITFTNKVFLTTFVQYNSQRKNINLNTRFQWRYRPAFDLFLVYTDNYYSSPLFVRNRAFVLKAIGGTIKW